MRDQFYRRQLASLIFTAVAGTFLHFLFDLSGQNALVGAISAVNESVWEHMKLLFFPMLITALGQRLLYFAPHKAFWCSQLSGILTGLVLIPGLYYTYTGALGVHFTWVDIAIFYVAAAAGYLVEALLMQLERRRDCPWERAALIALIILAGAFVVLTYFPPRLPIFQDPVTEGYGIAR